MKEVISVYGIKAPWSVLTADATTGVRHVRDTNFWLCLDDKPLYKLTMRYLRETDSIGVRLRDFVAVFEHPSVKELFESASAEGVDCSHEQNQD